MFEIVLNKGLGNWTGFANGGGILAVENAGQTSFEVGAASGSECSYRSFFLLSFAVLLRSERMHGLLEVTGGFSISIRQCSPPPYGFL